MKRNVSTLVFGILGFIAGFVVCLVLFASPVLEMAAIAPGASAADRLLEVHNLFTDGTVD